MFLYSRMSILLGGPYENVTVVIIQYNKNVQIAYLSTK